MSIIATNEEPEPPSFTLLGLIETMIRTYNLNEAERRRFQTLLDECSSQDGAVEIIDLMRNYRPLMGIERVPQDMKEINEAVRNRIDIDDFKERK
jgi:hypothetical protein